VSNPEFSPILAKILSILQIKLEAAKKSFEVDGNIGIKKLELIDIDSTTKSSLTDIILKVNKAVNECSNYSILLTSEFKEHHNEFLSLIELLCELKRKSQKDLESLKLDYLKLESIQSYNNQIDSNYSVDEDVLILSHKLMLTKLKSNVQNGIENKISQFNSAKALNVDLAKRTDLQISQLNDISPDRLVDHINTDFILTSIINKLKSMTISKMDDKKNEETKKNNSTPTNLEKKVIEEYDSLFAKYQTKDNISSLN
jgi:hypothetical protein